MGNKEIDPILQEVYNYCEGYEYNGRGVDLREKAPIRIIRVMRDMVTALGSEGQTMHDTVIGDVVSKPLRLCFLHWCENNLHTAPIIVATLLNAFLTGFTDFKPRRASRVEGIIDPDVADVYWESLHPTNIKRGRSDPGPQNKRRWTGDPDAPVEFNPEEK